MALRKGKQSISVVLKEDTVKKIEAIANENITSKSAIAGKIIEDNIDKYYEKLKAD